MKMQTHIKKKNYKGISAIPPPNLSEPPQPWQIPQRFASKYPSTPLPIDLIIYISILVIFTGLRTPCLFPFFDSSPVARNLPPPINVFPKFYPANNPINLPPKPPFPFVTMAKRATSSTPSREANANKDDDVYSPPKANNKKTFTGEKAMDGETAVWPTPEETSQADMSERQRRAAERDAKKAANAKKETTKQRIAEQKRTGRKVKSAPRASPPPLKYSG